ncbi:rod-binding protein [Candidatus Magnetominusculus xianensis]|nr:rod-binding protein [Candidatus Magnetominusculus xianensis]MBF0405136.1 rod-binding protein [Nitrospirota bacterium]
MDTVGALDSFRGIETLKGKKDSGTIEAVSKEIESVFMLELIKTMRKGLGTTFGKGLGGDVYMSMFDTELSRTLSKRGIGIGEVFAKELTRLSEKTDGKTQSDLKKSVKSTDRAL